MGPACAADATASSASAPMTNISLRRVPGIGTNLCININMWQPPVIRQTRRCLRIPHRQIFPRPLWEVKGGEVFHPEKQKLHYSAPATAASFIAIRNLSEPSFRREQGNA